MGRISKLALAISVAILLSLPVLAQTNPAQNNSAQPQSTPRLSTSPAGQTPSRRGGGAYDAQIQQEVTAELQKHDWAKEVRSSVEDGMVTLEGSVPVYMDKVRAYQKVHNKSHVQGVRNDIVVSGATVPDQQLRDKLADKLRYDRIGEGITFNNFTVGVQNGVVTIGGQARTYVDAQSALAIVEDTRGVKDVVDNIQVLPTSEFDDQIRLAVARAIYGNSSLQKYALDPQAPIRIVVDHGKVTLYGVVDSQLDKQIADTQARSVPNVFSVTDHLVVANQQPK